MGTRFRTNNPAQPMLGPTDAANLRSQFNALRAGVANLRTIAATVRTLVNELKADYTALRADVTEIRTKFNTHNHAYDDGSATEYTSLPNDEGTNDETVAATTAHQAAALTSTAIAAADVAAAAADTSSDLTEE